ncbi:MAG: hypothetical protein ACXAAP_09245 [Candidatus Thorarchaeota archaeon]|jgi:hypothetical protein
MKDKTEAMKFYAEQLSETKTLGPLKLILGFSMSTVIMGVSTYGLLYFVSRLNIFSFDSDQLYRYTLYGLAGLAGATILAGIICYIMYKRPRSVSFTLKIHSFLKRGSGEYFLCPEVNDQNLGQVVRRSLYGSLLVTGISLTILSFNLMTNANEGEILALGGMVMLVSVIVLPLTMMQFYYGPWLIKDSGLFHLDPKDRALSNVGDSLEDILEFVAGVDIVLVWLELTINTDLWVAPFIIIVALGPLFAIVLSFTLVFMIVKNRASYAMIELLLSTLELPDMVDSSDYIRKRVLALVDRRMLVEEAVQEYSKPTDKKLSDDLMTTMVEVSDDMEEAIDEVDAVSSSEPLIRKMRESLEEPLEEATDQAVTSLSKTDAMDDKSTESED